MKESKVRMVRENDYFESENDREKERNNGGWKDIKQPIGLVKSREDLEKRDEGYAKFSFNLLVSDRIGYHRSIPDTRNKL